MKINQTNSIPSYEIMEQKCYSYGLSGVEVFESLSDEEKKNTWNGIGPDSFPKWLREWLSKSNYLVLPACYIHDLDFTIGGNKKYFYIANKRLCNNSIKILKIHKKYLNFFEYHFAIFRAYVAWKLCDWFGYKGWHKC